MKYVKSLICINCGKEYKAKADRYLCPDCGEKGLLDVQYNYQKIRKNWSKEKLKLKKELNIWRYSPLLPIEDKSPKPNLRIGWTPLYKSKDLAKKIGLNNIFIKDDGLNPTGSLKDRASAIAAVKAAEFNSNVVACSSTGNAASSLAGNIASIPGNMKAVIFVPERAPEGKVTQLLIYGAEVISVQGSYEEAFYLSEKAIDKWNWYNRNAAINPYLVEGKKTAVLEIAEQLNWNMPNWLVFSVGDGCTIAGAWKGLYDLKQIGFINKVPKLLGVQAEGCAPITEVFRTGNDLKVTDEETLADSIAVGKPRNYKKAINGIKDSNGEMINVSDAEILDMMKILGRETGIFGEPAGVAGLAGLKKMIEKGEIAETETAVSVITGNGLKDVKNAVKAAGKPIEVGPDLAKLTKIFEEKNQFNNN